MSGLPQGQSHFIYNFAVPTFFFFCLPFNFLFKTEHSNTIMLQLWKSDSFLNKGFFGGVAY